MKKGLFVFLALVLAVMLQASCAKKKTPAAPISPPADTATFTVTATATITPTPTVTSTSTWTPVTSCGAPVTCGLVSSYDGSGGSPNTVSSATKYSLASGGVAYSMSFLVNGSVGQGRAGIYADGNPQSLIVQSGVVTIPTTSQATYTVSLVPNVYLPAGDYWIVVMTQGDGANDLWHSYHAQTGNSFKTSTLPTWGSLPSVLDVSGWGSNGNAAGNAMAIVCP